MNIKVLKHPSQLKQDVNFETFFNIIKKYFEETVSSTEFSNYIYYHLPYVHINPIHNIYIYNDNVYNIKCAFYEYENWRDDIKPICDYFEDFKKFNIDNNTEFINTIIELNTY